MIEITDSGKTYLKQLLDKQDCEGIAIRVFVLDGGTPKAETCIAFCRPGEEEADDEVFDYTEFKAFIESKSKQYLEEAVVDFAKDSMGAAYYSCPQLPYAQNFRRQSFGRSYQLHSV